MIHLSIIVPAYNEAATIIPLLESVYAQSVAGVSFEVIVVDDGSSDSTVALLEARSELYTTLIKRPFNGGKGASVTEGLRTASGDYVLFQDADLEYDPADYAALLRPILEYNADVVIGSRFLGPSCTRVAYFWNKLGNLLITLFFNVLNNTTFSDIYSCYLLYRRSLIDPERLIATGWDQHAEILSRAVAGGSRFYDVAINYSGRTVEEGKKIRAHHVFAVLWTILVRRLNH
jgi:glycosyltransferase involved in cell wall biosynthesis